jgi:site-specific DNA recombinase
VTNWWASTSTTGSPAPDSTGLDALCEAGLVERVWVLSPDRLARACAYQVLVLNELDRFGSPSPSPTLRLAADDPQATLLTQVQGVIAEYEKAKIAERYRRGELFRARAGEIVTWKASYGYVSVNGPHCDGPELLSVSPAANWG